MLPLASLVMRVGYVLDAAVHEIDVRRASLVTQRTAAPYGIDARIRILHHGKTAPILADYMLLPLKQRRSAPAESSMLSFPVAVIEVPSFLIRNDFPRCISYSPIELCTQPCTSQKSKLRIVLATPTSQ